MVLHCFSNSSLGDVAILNCMFMRMMNFDCLFLNEHTILMGSFKAFFNVGMAGQRWVICVLLSKMAQVTSLELDTFLTFFLFILPLFL